MANDYEIFEGKSLSDLFKDIYENTEKNRKQLFFENVFYKIIMHWFRFLT